LALTHNQSHESFINPRLTHD